MGELTSAQLRLAAEARDTAADPLRPGMTAYTALLSLRSQDYARDEDGNCGPTLAERHQLSEGQVDEVLHVLAQESGPAGGRQLRPVSSAPASPVQQPMPAISPSWDTTCVRRDRRSCIH